MLIVIETLDTQSGACLEDKTIFIAFSQLYFSLQTQELFCQRTFSFATESWHTQRNIVVEYFSIGKLMHLLFSVTVQLLRLVGMNIH